MPKLSVKRALSAGAKRVMQEMQVGARLVTRYAPLDNFGPNVLLRNGTPVKTVSEPLIRELLGAKRIVTTEPCEAQYVRCYAVAPQRTVQVAVAVRQNERPRSRTANMQTPKKPRGQM